MCTWETFSSLADVPFSGVIILCHGIGDTASCCGLGKVRVLAMAVSRKCVWRIRARRQLVVRAAQMCYSLFIIYTCAVPKMTVKTGPAKTGPAGALAMAMQMVLL